MNRNDTQEGELGYQLDTSSTTDGSSDNSQSDSVGSQDVVLNNQLSSSARCPLAPWEFLGKQFQEYKQSCPFLTALQQRERLYRLLPLFLQAFEQKAGLLSIPDISVMANDLGTLLAMEIRKRISNKPAGAARISLTKFLQGEEEEMPGYQLLKTIFVLSHKDQGVLCNLTKTGLPDVFLQSLYLFLAFPPGQGTINDLQESEILVQDIFTQTMLNLCSHAQGVENLTRSSDFECLLKAAASGWDRCDMRWSDAVEMVFKVVSKTLTPGMLHYLHTFRCIPSFLQILSQRVNAVVPRVLCQVTVILLSFLSQSCVLSPYLLQDFENTQGYPLMLKILMRCEGDTTVKEGGGQHLDELFTLLTSLVVFGKSEVKVSGQVSHPQLPGFSLGRTTDSSKTVKNLQAFQVLQSAFQNSKDAHLCGKVLSSMQSLWTLENINFFLLEWSLQPISQFVEILPLKPPSVQNQFFQLIQFVVSELSYIPHKILQKVQELIKQNPSPSCTLAALILLQNITPIDSLFSDLFRDSGLLGMLLTQLRNHAKIIRRRGFTVANIAPEVEGECEREITIRRLQTVGVLLQASVRNVVILKDYGMIPYIKIFLDDMGFRRGALCILEHISAVDPDEYMSTIIGALCSSTQAEVILKLDLLQSLHRILRSPREQTSFRNAAGFDVLLSVLSDMEGCLGDPPEGCWSEVQPVHIFGLIRSTLSAMTAALCHNVTNQHFVQSQGIFQKLADGLMHLGCFSPPLTPYTYKNNAEVSSRARTLQDLLSLVLSSQTDCPQSLRSCFMILSILLGMAAGTLNQVGQDHATKQITVELPMRDVQGFSEGQKDLQGELQELIQYLLPRNSDSCPQEELVTLEPGALCAVISLIQNTYSKDNQEKHVPLWDFFGFWHRQLSYDTHMPIVEKLQLSKEIQCVILEHIQTMGQSERRRQVLCDSQLLNCVVKYCRKSLMDHGDPLRLPLVRLFEKLAFQAVRPDVLRQFLCCGITVQQNNIQETLTDAQASVHSLHLSPGSVLHTSVSLVSMTSPRRFQTGSASMSPSFVEFDMSTHGSGCLFLPTIGTILGSNVNEILSGGVGAGARNFPPPGGLSFTCWFLVSKLCLAPEPHPVRFLTIIRHMSRSQQHFVCLSIMLNAAEHSLLISTEEREFQPLDMMEVELSPCSSPCHLSQVRLNVSGLIVTEHWHHLSVVLKEVKRSCVVNAWIDGQLLGSAEMRYVQRLPGGSSSLDPSSLVDIHAFLGTPQMWQQQSSLLWRLGFSYLFEEVLSEETLRLIHRLGPSYCGNFKHVDAQEDPCSFLNSHTYSMPSSWPIPLPPSRLKPVSSESTASSSSHTGSGHCAISTLLSEDKCVFGINGLSSCISTVSQIRDLYNEVDGRHIAKELGISSRDNSTPIFLSRNLALHLPGSSRTLGAVTIQSKGVRVFHSSPAADTLNYIGGPAVLLSLISMATDDQALYAAIKALVSVMSSSLLADVLMQQMDGYRLLAFLLKEKSYLLNPRIFQLILTITGTADLGVGPVRPLNLCAVRHILCDFQLWLEVPGDLDLSLLNHLVEVLRGLRNTEIIQQLQLVPRLVFLLSDPHVVQTKVTLICTLLRHCLSNSFNRRDISMLGLFLVSTLPATSVDEKQLHPQDPSLEAGDALQQGLSEKISTVSERMIWLRNQLLSVLIEVMCPPSSCLSEQQQETVLVTLGADWFLLFIQPSLHLSSLLLGMRLVGHLLQNQTLLSNFREVTKAGACVQHSTYELHILMDNIRSNDTFPTCNFPLVSGFTCLLETIHHHKEQPEIYLFLFSVFLRAPQDEGSAEGDMGTKLQDLLQNHSVEQILQIGLCKDAALLLLTMVKATLCQESEDRSRALIYCNTAMQFLCRIYHNYPSDALWTTADFINTLASLLLQPMGQDSGHPEVDEEHSGTKETIGGKKEHHINSTRKPVQELLNCILRQSLTQHSALKQDHPLEHLLEVFPVNVSIEQKNRFQTEILQCTMEMFLAISHWGELQNDELCGTSGTEILEEVAIANLSYFSQKLLEKMLCGGFTADPCKILLFFIKQITAVTHTTAPCNRDSLFTMMYGYLNRSILHCLSRPRQTLMEVRNVLKTLELLLSHWDVIFTTYNSSLSFAACLMHCLFQIYSGSYPEGFGVKSKAHSSWQLIFLSKDEEDEQVDGPDMQEVLVQVLHAVQTVWEQLMVYRRQILEEHYKMDLSVKQGEGQISQVTPLWEETASKAWQQYLASEKKNLKSKNKVSASPGQRITAAVRGLYGGIEPEVECKAQDTAFSLDLYRRQVQDVFKCLFRDHQQMQQCRHMAASRDWSALEKELFSEGGVWESLWSQNNQSWEINPCEDPWRTRKRIQPVLRKLETKVLQKIMIDGATAILVALYWTRREWFEDLVSLSILDPLHLPPRVDLLLQCYWCQEDVKKMALKVSRLRVYVTSKFNKCMMGSSSGGMNNIPLSARVVRKHCRAMHCVPIWQSKNTVETRGEISLNSVTSKEGGWKRLYTDEREETGLTFFPTLQDSSFSFPKVICTERLTILQEFPEKEKISLKMPVVLVEGHVILEGVLLFGRDHFYLCPDFILSSSGDITCRMHGVSSIEDPFIHDLCYKDITSLSPSKTNGMSDSTDGEKPESPYRKSMPVIPRSECYSYQEVLDLQSMYFLMQEIALEIFFKNRISKFIVFPNKDVNVAIKWFHSLMPSLKVKSAGEDPQNIRSSAGEKLMLQKWQRREVGNFEYLMFLNSLSGRTIRDLMQYPLMPWVLQDYKSETLDLSDPKVFRDLSKPMGAQSPGRSQKFIQRYQDVEKNDGELSMQCHYCTHYSSASIVSSYLVRVEPFTQAMQYLQDRLKRFSLEQEHKGRIQIGSLGFSGNGKGGSLDLADRLFHSVAGAWESASTENMSDVRELIPEFFYLPEMFTNCNNCQLGCMQDGTVVGDVILPPWARGDPHTFVRLHREALESEYVSSHLHHWIDLMFGYKQRGPAAVQALNVFHPYFYGSPAHLNSTDPLVRSTLIGYISNFGQVPKQLFTKPHPPRQGKELSTGHLATPFYSAPSCLKHVIVTPRAGALHGAVGQMVLTDKGVFAVEKNHVMLLPSCTMSLSWGHSDGSIKLQTRSTRKVLGVWELMSHWGWCHCIVCPISTLVVTAMSSSVLCAWEFRPPGPKYQAAELKLKKVLIGHGSAVLCVCSSAQNSVMVSGSTDGSCIIWDLDKLNCFKRLPTHPGEVTCVTISDSTGAIISCCSSALYVWSVNGDPISYVCTGSNILSCCFGGLSVIIIGSEDGAVSLWKMETAGDQKVEGLGGKMLGTSLQMFHRLTSSVPATGKQQRPAAVTALAISRNYTKLLVGDERGVITSWHLD